MKISIWDLDYYTTHKGFNPQCMKIASYHKQRGDSVIFITSERDCGFPYDEIYITKNDDSIPNPPVKFFDKRSKIWGNGFKYLSNWKIPDIILQCRPDYMLYPEKDNSFERAEMVQFFNNDGDLLGLTQDFHNSFKKSKKTLIIDTAFWKASEKNIIFALKSLKDEKNCAFLEPIWLKKIIYNKAIRENFLALNFKQNCNFIFKNNVGDNFEAVEQIVKFLKELREHSPTISLGYVNFDTITTNHFQSSANAWYDFERDLKIVSIGKENGFLFKLQPIVNRVTTPYNSIFETLVRWSETKMSLLEFIAMPIAKKYNISLETVYANAIKWDNTIFFEMMSALKPHKDWIDKYCLRKWKNNYLSITRIDWENIKENI